MTKTNKEKAQETHRDSETYIFPQRNPIKTQN